MDVQYLETLEIPVGKLARVELKGRDVDLKRSMTGIVTACNERHFMVQGQNYDESFLKIDLVLGLIRLTELKIELAEQKRSDVIELIPWTSREADGNDLELILDSAE